MVKFFLSVGIVVCGLGGTILTVAIVCFCAWLAVLAWMAFSNKFRSICKAESMIFEYKKYRKQFMKWMQDVKRKENENV
jgi:hypothetical protein